MNICKGDHVSQGLMKERVVFEKPAAVEIQVFTETLEMIAESWRVMEESIQFVDGETFKGHKKR